MKYSVSDISKLLGVTSAALHYLEKENLIEVEKDEKGHRYYNVVDVFRFLSYTKYRSMGFPMKTVITQFSGVEDDRDMIIPRIRHQRDEAIKMARHYQDLASAIDDHLISAERIDRLLGQYEFERCPATLILHDEECGWISKNRDAQALMQKWIKAMPAVRLAVLMPDPDASRACFGYAVTPERADALNLPRALHVREISPASCLHTIVATDEGASDDPYRIFRGPIAYAQSRGFAVSGMPWGHMLLVEVAPGAHLKPYVELWIPIK